MSPTTREEGEGTGAGRLAATNDIRIAVADALASARDYEGIAQQHAGPDSQRRSAFARGTALALCDGQVAKKHRGHSAALYVLPG